MRSVSRFCLRRFSTKPGKNYDAVVIGAGHNGLAAAAYLQKSGFRVCVLESRNIIGGAAVTEEIIPGFKFSRASYVLSLLRPQIYHELKLKDFGLKVLPRDPSSYTPLRDSLWKGEARSLTLSTDSSFNAREIRKFSERDAVAFGKYEKQLMRMALALDPLLDASPHEASQIFQGGLFSRIKSLMKNPELRLSAQRLISLGPEIFSLYELLTASPLQILKRWFESEELITTLAMDAVIGTKEAPSAAGTGYVLLLHSIMGECDGGRGRWGYPVGGMGAVSQAIAASAQALGVDIFTNQKVTEILLDGDGTARGVKTNSELEISAKLILSNATPKVTFLDLLPQASLDKDFVSAVKNIDYSSCVTKLNVAVNKLPNFKANPNIIQNEPMPHHQTTIHLNSERIDSLHDAFLDSSQGRYSRRPLIEMVIPSVLDNSIAPNGCHVCLMFTQYTPYHLANSVWDSETKEEYAKLVFSQVDEYAPGFSESVVGKDVLSPVDIEQIFGLTGGNIFHGAMSPDKLFLLRPTNYCVTGKPSPLTPVPRLLLCGSGAHPGGGVSGAPGRIAAKEALKILK